MKILAASLVSYGDQFLHVGYISASTRSLEECYLPFNTPQWVADKEHPGQEMRVPREAAVTLDVGDALRLKDEASLTASAIPNTVRWASPSVGKTDIAVLIGGVVLGVALLALVYTIRRKKAISAPTKPCERGTALFTRVFSGRRKVPVLVALACLTLFGLFETMMFARDRFVPLRNFQGTLIPSADAPAPWENSPRFFYQNPQEATLVLLHGVIADALACVGPPVENLAQIQNEVALPYKDLTPGMRYALNTYGLDGWGRPFRLESKDVPHDPKWTRRFREGRLFEYHDSFRERLKARYVITSSGADGVFDTADDLKAVAYAGTEYYWDDHRQRVFFFREGDAYVVLYHRWGGKLFRYGNAEHAQSLTGNAYFDLISLVNDKHDLPEIPGTYSESTKAMLDALASKTRGATLVLQVFEDEGEG